MLALAVPETTSASETTFRYDPLGRLVATTNSAGPTSTLRYDPAGNRTEYIVTTAGGAAPLVIDGSFESPPQEPGWYQYRPQVTGVTFLNNAGVTTVGGAWGFQQTDAGGQLAFLQGGTAAAVISLDVSGMTVGAAYQVTFKIGRRAGYNPTPVSTAITFGTATTPLGAFTPASEAFSTVATTTFIATAATGVLSFTGTTSVTDISTGIDAIAVEPVAGAPTVPNFSFESPAVADYLYNPTTSFVNGAGVARVNGSWGFSAAPDGSQVAFLQGSGATVKLQVSGLSPNTTYRVLFHLAARNGNTGPTVDVGYKDANSTNIVSLNSFAPSGPAFIQKTSGTFVAVGSTGTLSFTAQPIAGDQTTFVDRVLLELAQ